MKLPKKFNKMSSEEQRQWIAERLKIVRAEENALVKLSRLLAKDDNFRIKVEERPDLEYQIEQ